MKRLRASGASAPAVAWCASAAALACACSLAFAAGCNEPPQSNKGIDWVPQGTWVEVWRDDFDGPAGSAPDTAAWNVVTNLNPPNGEFEAYTNRRENSFLDGDGHLVLRAIQEEYMGRSYTSGRLDTRGKQQHVYGRFEARIQIPEGRGLWPAFWLLGASGGWPASGEIDVMEIGGSQAALVHGSLHGPNYFGGGAFVNKLRLPSGSFADGFHLFAVEWTEEGIRWLADDQPYHAVLKRDLVAMGKTWVFDAPFFIIVNLAVGGVFDGPPSPLTPFPSELRVDQVRVLRLER